MDLALYTYLPRGYSPSISTIRNLQKMPQECHTKPAAKEKNEIHTVNIKKVMKTRRAEKEEEKKKRKKKR